MSQFNINVSNNSGHVLAVASRSLNTSHEKALEIYNRLTIAYPSIEGYRIDFSVELTIRNSVMIAGYDYRANKSIDRLNDIDD